MIVGIEDIVISAEMAEQYERQGGDKWQSATQVP